MVRARLPSGTLTSGADSSDSTSSTFFLKDTAPTKIYTPLYTLSLHDALPILRDASTLELLLGGEPELPRVRAGRSEEHTSELQSHSGISYAVFCLKKKKE